MSSSALAGLATGRLVAAICFACLWVFGVSAGLADTSAVAVKITSTPPLPNIRPDADLAHVTLHVWLNGTPLQRGHIQVKVTAPPHPALLSTDFPVVEGTDLLGLASDMWDGIFTFAYLFPIRGTYMFDLAVAPVPGGPDFAPTSLRQTIQLYENAAEVRNAWLLIIGLFVLGGVAGVVFARSAAAREALLSVPTLMLLALLASAPGSAAAQVAQDSPAGAGAAAWTLEVHPTPAQAMVGQLVQFSITLNKDGKVFAHPTRVLIDVHHVEDDKTVLQATTYAPDGRTAPLLQFFDGAPHTVTVTAQPVEADDTPAVPLQAVVAMDVVAMHPPMAVKIRTLALLLSVLVAGMVGGFFVPCRWKG
jgi:hypothetical protein